MNEYKENQAVSQRGLTIDFVGIFEDLRKQLFYILLLSIAAGMFAFVFLSYRTHASYSSSATVAVNNIHYATNTETYDMLGYATDVAGKMKSILESDELKETVAGDLGYSGFAGSVSVQLVENTNLLRITVSSDSPLASYMEVKSILDNYKLFAGRFSGGAFFNVLEYPVISEKPELLAVSKKKVLIAALGVFMLLCAAGVLNSLRRNSVHNSADLTAETGLPYLGSIYRDAKHPALGHYEDGKLITDPGAGLRYQEGVRRLAIGIDRRMKSHGFKTLTLTSTLTEEGKSAAAANLAIALAQMGKKVILADMDFYDPSLHKLLKVTDAESADLIEYLKDRSAKQSGGQQNDSQERSAKQANTDLSGLFQEVPGTGILLVSPRSACPDAVDRYAGAIRELLEDLSKQADYVIIDTPALDKTVDAGELADMADTTFLVARRNKANGEQIRSAVAALGGKDRMLGCLMNDVLKYTVSASGSAEKDLIERENVGELQIDFFQFMSDFWLGVRRGFIGILAAMLVCGGIFYFGAKSDVGHQYTAYTTFTVVPTESLKYRVGNQKNICISLIGRMIPSVMTSDAMKFRILEDIGYDHTQALPASIDVTEVGNTNLIKLSVKSGDAQAAYDVMESALSNCSEICNAMFGTVTIDRMDESGVPTKLEGAKSGKKAAALGMLLGLIAALFVIAVHALLKETILSGEELRWMLNAKSLGIVPWISAKEKGSLISIDSPDTAREFVESIRTIRQKLEREQKENNTSKILVTSSIPAEGKTTVAMNLAKALANHDYKVLVIDADLRQPTANEALGLENKNTPGLTELLEGECTLGDAIHTFGDQKNLQVLPAGKSSSNPASLWSRPEAKALMDDLGQQYDFVIIDGPQSSVLSEVSLISELSDACVYVVRRNHAKIDQVYEGVETFEGADCRFLGCVMRQ